MTFTVLPEQRYSRLTVFGTTRQVVLPGATDYSYGAEESTAIETHDLKTDGNMVQAIRYVVADILGFSRKEGTRIFRKQPAQHPLNPSMYATRVSKIEMMAPTGKSIGVTGEAATFKQARLTVGYATPPYKVIGAELSMGQDPFLGTSGTEDQRYFQPLDYEASTEFVQQKMGTFKWPAGATTALPGKPIPESNGRAITVTKTKMTFLWVQVPDVGLFDGGFDASKVSTNINNSLGKVNDDTFMGFPRGTILFLGWKPTPRMMPIPETYMGLQVGDVPRAWDVQLVFSYFNPTPVGTHAAGPSGTPAGHNLIPDPKGNWFRILYNTAGATDSSAYWKYQEANLKLIFQMN